MRETVDLHDRDVVVVREVDHLPHEARFEQRHITARYVRRIDSSRKRLQPCPKPFELATSLVLIAGDDYTCWQWWKVLVMSGNDDDR